MSASRNPVEKSRRVSGCLRGSAIRGSRKALVLSPADAMPMSSGHTTTEADRRNKSFRPSIAKAPPAPHFRSPVRCSTIGRTWRSTTPDTFILATSGTTVAPGRILRVRHPTIRHQTNRGPASATWKSHPVGSGTPQILRRAIRTPARQGVPRECTLLGIAQIRWRVRRSILRSGRNEIALQNVVNLPVWLLNTNEKAAFKTEGCAHY